MVASSFAVWALFHENNLLLPSSSFHFFSGAGEAQQETFRKLLQLWQDSPAPAGWAILLFPILLFWFCFRIALSSIFLSSLVNEWTSFAMSFGWEKWKRKERARVQEKERKTSLWCFGLVAVRLFSWGHHSSFTRFGLGCWVELEWNKIKLEKKSMGKGQLSDFFFFFLASVHMSLRRLMLSFKFILILFPVLYAPSQCRHCYCRDWFCTL